jgi:recombinational DNA repair protein (RecF pathway)
MVDSLRPQAKLGRPPKVHHCPWCHAALNVTEMKRHRPQCARDHRNAPPQEPQDLENQALSDSPLQRERQLDQQEQDRIQRTPKS